MAKKKPATKTKEAETTPKDEALETVLKAFNQAWEYTSGSWHDRWQNNYKLYNNERVKYGYHGISDTFVPMTFGTVETLTSALFGTKPKWGYIPPSNKPDQSTEILNSLVDYYWDKDQWSMKIINTGRGMLREGTAVDYFCWDRDHPKLINVAIRDFFINSNDYEIDEATTHELGRRYITTLEDLESYEIVDFDAMDKATAENEGKVDPETGKPLEVETVFKKKYKNLDELKGRTQEEPVNGSTQYQDQTTDKQEKDMLYGSTLNEPQKDQVEVIEYWTVDRTISVANRRYVIEDTENYFKAKDRANGNKFPQGLLPFAPARDYVDGSLFYAKSEVDFISDQQEDLNDISNQNKDAISFNLNQMKTLNPKYAHMLQEIKNIPGGVYPMEDGMLVPIPNGQIPPEAFNERQNIKAEIRETTASNEVVKGSAQTGKGEQTATEINAQIAGAGQRISLKVTQIENEYFHRMAKIIFKMIQLYVTEPQMVRILGKDGVKWEEFDPAEFDGEYEPRVQLDISIQSQKEHQATDAANLLKAFLGDPNVNQKELTKLVLARGFELDPDEVDLLMTPDPMAAMQGGMPPMPGAEQPPMPGQEDIPGGIDTDQLQALLAAAGGQEGQQEPVETGPSATDIVEHPETGEPVMAGAL